METLEQIKKLTEELSVNATKFFQGGNKSAGTRTSKLSQELKDLLQNLRKEILEEKKSAENE